MLNMLSSFLPMILFSIISGFSFSIAIIVAILTSFFSFSKLKKGFFLEWSQLFFFIISFVVVIICKIKSFSLYMDISLIAMLATVTWISLLIKKPFTMQYAKLEVPKEFWKTLFFLRINKIMTITFGVCFLCLTLINIFKLYNPGVVIYSVMLYSILILQIAFRKWFPPWYQRRYNQRSNLKLKSEEQS